MYKQKQKIEEKIQNICHQIDFFIFDDIVLDTTANNMFIFLNRMIEKLEKCKQELIKND